MLLPAYQGTGGLTSGANPLWKLNKEIKRRTGVVGVFPNPEALLRVASSVLVEAYDEWQTASAATCPKGA